MSRRRCICIEHSNVSPDDEGWGGYRLDGFLPDIRCDFLAQVMAAVENSCCAESRPGHPKNGFRQKTALYMHIRNIKVKKP